MPGSASPLLADVFSARLFPGRSTPPARGLSYAVGSLADMSGAFDVARAMRAGLGDRQHAWEFIRGLAAEWISPLAPGDGVSEDVLWAAEQRLRVNLPAALREAYLLFGRRSDLTAVQDPLVPPEGLRADHSGSIVVFRLENQHCAEWGVATEDDWNPADPPVYVRRQPGDRRWEPFMDRVSIACLEMALSELLIGRGRLGDMCQLPAELITGVESAYDQLPVPEYRSWYDRSVTVRWFFAPGKLLRMDGRGPGCWLIAGGKTPADLKSIRTTFPGPWIQTKWPDEKSQR